LILRVVSHELSQSIEAVKFWQFAVATLFYWPKLALQVFIGTRIAALSDREERKHMDTRKDNFPELSMTLMCCNIETKVVNGLLIGFGIIVAIASGR
jgi:hypothetical protein